MAGKRETKQAIRDAKVFGLELHTTFSGWQLPAAEAYSGKAPPSEPGELETAVRREVERVLSVTLGRRFRRICTSPPDVTVAVEVRGAGIKGGPYAGPDGRRGHAVSGAAVQGAVAFQPAPGEGGATLPPLQRRFSGSEPAPDVMADYRAWGAPPFAAALRAAGLQSVVRGLLAKAG